MERRGQEQRGLDRAGAGRLYEAVDLGVPISPGTLVVDLQVQLLISAQDVENYKVIKSELDRLRTMVEKSELWVDKKGTSKGEEGEAGPAKDKKEVCGVWGPGQGPANWLLIDPAFNSVSVSDGSAISLPPFFHSFPQSLGACYLSDTVPGALLVLRWSRYGSQPQGRNFHESLSSK